LFSEYRHVVAFGLVNVVVVAMLAAPMIDGFASLWYVYAAVASGAIALDMRFAKAHRTAPYSST
jgi:hypothetical protein